MSRVRLTTIVIAALLAALAAAGAALWMSARPAPPVSSDAQSVEIEIPSGSGPSTAAQLDSTAMLDPGKPLDAGAAPALPDPAAARR